ncbi:hypothetical protein CANINC_001633 [Pichia inconspicua]|uniref:Activator of C kinase protein 1 n=1 Tax=Pichia inconspicua TaxID=52247 RepID=A0A4T0X3B3_9ASCO|nr:hypothetical protein CANINC_001633 [[Candida] inconspicua]
MKKSQVRSQLLDDSAVFVNPRTTKKQQHAHAQQQSQPQQHPLRYTTHPLAQNAQPQQQPQQRPHQHPHQHSMPPPQQQPYGGYPGYGYVPAQGPPPGQGPPPSQNYYSGAGQNYYPPPQGYYPPPQENIYQYENQQQAPPQQQRAVSYQQGHPTQTQPVQKPRATSYQYQEVAGRPAPVNSFVVEDSDIETVPVISTNEKEDPKLLALEEKIQRLERVLAMQELESKLRQPNESSKSSVLSDASEDNVQPPPLPPMPPVEQKRGSSVSASELLAVDSLRHSKASLIPSEKEEGDEDDEEEEEEEEDGEEPPPSYEELEKSGSLTYSQSIYRTGFEKAGYQMDQGTPVSARDEKSELRRILEEERKKKAETTAPSEVKSQKLPVKKKSESLMMKRKIPMDMEEPVVANVQSSPPKPTLTNTITQGASSLTPTVVKYSTKWSYKSHSNGVVEPVLPSQSEQPVDEAIAEFRTVREDAVRDYKAFTPRVQFTWAILLLETVAKSEVVRRMSIDGKLRRSPLVGAKKIRRQRVVFLATAVKVLEKLVQVAPNETRARLYLGDIYSGGIHPGLLESKDESRGFTLFWDAAVKQGDPVACYRIACCLESGVGCRQDVPESIVFFEKGASLGDPSSMCQLGMMHFAGLNGCVQDVALAVSYHKQAYETLRKKEVMSFDPLISARSFQDARGALYTLAKLHQTDRQILCLTDETDLKTRETIKQLKENNVWCNRVKALKYYIEAAKLGHNEAQAGLGYYYSQGFFPTYLFKSDKEAGGENAGCDARKSIYWFSKAAAEGHVYAALGLARWYGSGAVDDNGKIILRRDEQQAFLWGRKAADAGELVEAEYMIGVCFEQGFGVERNFTMARNYFERSARKGYKKAIHKLRTLG